MFATFVWEEKEKTQIQRFYLTPVVSLSSTDQFLLATVSEKRPVLFGQPEFPLEKQITSKLTNAFGTVNRTVYTQQTMESMNLRGRSWQTDLQRLHFLCLQRPQKKSNICDMISFTCISDTILLHQSKVGPHLALSTSYRNFTFQYFCVLFYQKIKR